MRATSETPATVSELQWEEQQDARRTVTRREGRAALRRFALVFVLIALTLAVVTVISRMPLRWPVSL